MKGEREDRRVTAARNLVVELREELDDDYGADIVQGLLDYAEERLRINTGLIAQNTALRRGYKETP